MMRWRLMVTAHLVQRRRHVPAVIGTTRQAAV
jgi:hypothetical protein